MLLVVAALAFAHHVDHVLRADNSGWPVTPDVPPVTINHLVGRLHPRDISMSALHAPPGSPRAPRVTARSPPPPLQVGGPPPLALPGSEMPRPPPSRARPPR